MNENPEIVELNAETSIDELEYVRREFSGSETTVYFGIKPNETVSWGKFFNGKSSESNCIANTNNTSDFLVLMKCYLSYNYTVTLEYPPYSRLNIKYEYLRDGKIRPFNSRGERT